MSEVDFPTPPYYDADDPALRFRRGVLDLNVRIALERLLEATRWRADYNNSDGEDFGPEEIEAFDVAEKALRAVKSFRNPYAGSFF